MPAYTVHIAPNQRALPFKTAEDVEAWMAAQLEAFEWLYQHGANPYGQGHPQLVLLGLSAAHIALTQLRGFREQWATSSDEAERQRILTEVSGLYTSRRLLATETPGGKLVSERLSRHQNLEAAAAFTALTQAGDDPQAGIFRGYFDALNLMAGRAGAAKHAEALEALVERWQGQFAEVERQAEAEARETREQRNAELMALRASFEEKLAAFETQVAQDREQSDMSLRAMKERLAALSEHASETRAAMEAEATAHTVATAEHVEQTKAELERIRTTYATEVSLRKPITFWEDKGRRHTRYGLGALGAVVVMGTAFGVFFLREVAEVLRPDGSAGVAGTGANAGQVVTLLTIATLGLWALRLVVRAMLSQQHLATDAAERAVLIKTYLSMREHTEFDEKERHLVFQTVFRPSADGIVKEDSAPPSIPEVLTRALSRLEQALWGVHFNCKTTTSRLARDEYAYRHLKHGRLRGRRPDQPGRSLIASRRPPHGPRSLLPLALSGATRAQGPRARPHR